MSEEFADIGFAKVDLSREQRCGRAEVIYGEGKTPEQILEIASVLRERVGRFLVTRVGQEYFHKLEKHFPGLRFHKEARCLSFGDRVHKSSLHRVGVVAAGTSDESVQEEVMTTLEFFGWQAKRFTDVGVAGLHRLLANVEELRACDVLIVVAGMEGALPSVVGGLVDCPVIAVPTSVGYGANLGGVTALLGMLTSCASGISVVNIDNGFGAACSADAILRLIEKKRA
ncbi:MAG: nickel pincer cofactor biosynthesis protein LarB [Chthoniobacterales bacterium]